MEGGHLPGKKKTIQGPLKRRFPARGPLELKKIKGQGPEKTHSQGVVKKPKPGGNLGKTTWSQKPGKEPPFGKKNKKHIFPRGTFLKKKSGVFKKARASRGFSRKNPPRVYFNTREKRSSSGRRPLQSLYISKLPLY